MAYVPETARICFFNELLVFFLIKIEVQWQGQQQPGQSFNGQLYKDMTATEVCVQGVCMRACMCGWVHACMYVCVKVRGWEWIICILPLC